MRLEGRNQGKRNTDYAEWGMKIWMGISRKLERRASLGLSASATEADCREAERAQKLADLEKAEAARMQRQKEFDDRGEQSHARAVAELDGARRNPNLGDLRKVISRYDWLRKLSGRPNAPFDDLPTIFQSVVKMEKRLTHEAEEAEEEKREDQKKVRQAVAAKKAATARMVAANKAKRQPAPAPAPATRKREKAMKIAVDKGYLSVNGEPLVYSERVHNVTKNFLINLAGFDKNIRNGEAFSFAFDAHIEDEDTLHLFIASVREILEENGLFERSMFEHDGFLDRDANADAERDYANVTEIRYLLLSDSNFLECPCCESSKDVHTIQVTDDAGGWSDMLRYKCMDACDVSFRQTFGGDIVWDMAFPHCDTCGDSDDVYEDWENGICQAQDSENEHGCGPFYCSNCDGDNSDGHRISTDGGCVDTSCECDDWDD